MEEYPPMTFPPLMPCCSESIGAVQELAKVTARLQQRVARLQSRALDMSRIKIHSNTETNVNGHGSTPGLWWVQAAALSLVTISAWWPAPFYTS